MITITIILVSSLEEIFFSERVGAMQVTNASQDIFVVSHENLSGLNAVAKDEERQKFSPPFTWSQEFLMQKIFDNADNVRVPLKEAHRRAV